MDSLAHLRTFAFSQIGKGANLTWFTPKAVFWRQIAPFKKQVEFVDAGCGVGDLTRRARQRGYKMLPIDLLPRDGQIPGVLRTDATMFSYGPNRWPLFCRPDHSGWVYDAATRALSQDATVFYVSLPKNKERDLDDLDQYLVKEVEGVGQEGEHMWILHKAGSAWDGN